MGWWYYVVSADAAKEEILGVFQIPGSWHDHRPQAGGSGEHMTGSFMLGQTDVLSEGHPIEVLQCSHHIVWSCYEVRCHLRIGLSFYTYLKWNPVQSITF